MKMSVALLTVFSLPLLLGCSHVGVVAFDKRANTVTVQGGKWASEEDYQKAAEKYCGGPATLLSMNQREAGAYSSISGNTMTTVPIRRWDRTFTCGT